jgi:uncharacterized protein (TIGR02001 family)
MAAPFGRQPGDNRGSYLIMAYSNSVLRGMTLALLGGAAFMMAGGAARAADLGGMKDAPPPVEEVRTHSITVNGGLTTDYVFRGQSQSDEGPSVFAGVDLAYGIFYTGFWAASVDDFVSEGDVEIDVYAGIKRSYNGVDFDLGVIYYTYPDDGYPFEVSYLELKASASAKIWRDITVTGTVFYSPDYTGEAGATWTFEGKASAPLPMWGLTASGAVGHVTSDDDDGVFTAAFGDESYTYWNVGLSRTFREHYTIDVRYWGSDADPATEPAHSNVDDRVVATFTFNY